MTSQQSQSSEVSDTLTSSQLCYLELLQQEIPEGVLDLDYFWHPEDRTSTGNQQAQQSIESDDLSDSQLVTFMDEFEASNLPANVMEELLKPFDGKFTRLYTIIMTRR
jgi:hypothetical protein